MLDGARTGTAPQSGQPVATLARAREWFEHDWQRLPAAVRDLSAPEPLPVRVSDGLRELTERVDARDLAGS